VIKKEVEKFLKYKDHRMETQRRWNVKTKVIPVTKGAIGTHKRSLRNYLKKKYRETTNSRNEKTKVKPVTKGAIGSHKRSLRKYLKKNTGKPRIQGNTEHGHIGHFAHTSRSVNVKVFFVISIASH
jgi:hypothetical protein